MDFKTKSGKFLSIDLEKWTITSQRTCKIIREEDDDYIIENKTKQTAKISKSIISDNRIDIIDSHVEFSEAIYNYYFLKESRVEAEKRMNDIFEQNIELIFSNRELVLSKAEYYLLRPRYLTSGGAYIGGFSYSLGALIDSFTSGEHFFFEELSGFKKMYLIKIVGSPLSGAYSATFWADEERKIVSLGSGNGISFPMPFTEVLKEFRGMVSGVANCIDFEDQVIEQLVKEMNELN